jgi:hypothetical protein
MGDKSTQQYVCDRDLCLKIASGLLFCSNVVGFCLKASSDAPFIDGVKPLDNAPTYPSFPPLQSGRPWLQGPSCARV